MNQINDIITDNAKYLQMSAASIEFFKRNYTEVKMIEALVKEYERLNRK